MLQFSSLTQLEGIAVRALFLRRIHLVSSNLYTVQRAVIRCAAMVCTLVYTTVNALVCMTFFHVHVLLFIDSVIAFPTAHIFMHQYFVLVLFVPYNPPAQAAKIPANDWFQ